MRFDACGNGCVPESCAIEMNPQSPMLGQFINVAHLFNGIDASASTIVCIFETDEFGNGKMVIQGPDRSFDRRGFHNATNTIDQIELDARKRPCRTALKIVGMGRGFDDHIISGLRMRLDRQLIGHGPGGNEDGCLLSKEACHLFLEGVDRGVLPEDVVPDLCPGHGLSHGRSGLGHRVASQIDKLLHGSSITGLSALFGYFRIHPIR